MDENLVTFQAESSRNVENRDVLKEAALLSKKIKLRKNELDKKAQLLLARTLQNSENPTSVITQTLLVKDEAIAQLREELEQTKLRETSLLSQLHSADTEKQALLNEVQALKREIQRISHEFSEYKTDIVKKQTEYIEEITRANDSLHQQLVKQARRSPLTHKRVNTLKQRDEPSKERSLTRKQSKGEDQKLRRTKTPRAKTALSARHPKPH